MVCPACGSKKSCVLDSYETQDGAKTYRRRRCRACEARWSTDERVISGTVKNKPTPIYSDKQQAGPA